MKLTTASASLRFLTLWLLLGAKEAPAAPVVVSSFSDPALEALSGEIAPVLQLAGMGNCEPVLLKAKSEGRESGTHIQGDISEILSRLAPEEMQFDFGLLVAASKEKADLERTFAGLPQLPRETWDPGLSDSLSKLAERTGFISTNATFELQSGTYRFLALENGRLKTSGTYRMAVLIDAVHEEFLAFGAGYCEFSN